MEKSSHELVKLQTSAALDLEQAPVFYIKSTPAMLLGIRSSSSCDGWRIAYWGSSGFSVMRDWSPCLW